MRDRGVLGEERMRQTGRQTQTQTDIDRDRDRNTERVEGREKMDTEAEERKREERDWTDSARVNSAGLR